MNYPRWITTPGGQKNLREVSPRLFVGAQLAPSEFIGAPWELVVSLCGGIDENKHRYKNARRVISAKFNDGEVIPDGYLDKIVPRVFQRLKQGPVLLHCAAGMSRSASVAYAALRVGYGLTHEQALRQVRVPGHELYPMSVTLGSARAWVQQVQQAQQEKTPRVTEATRA